MKKFVLQWLDAGLPAAGNAWVHAQPGVPPAAWQGSDLKIPQNQFREITEWMLH
jgi:hypothetical protein